MTELLLRNLGMDVCGWHARIVVRSTDPDHRSEGR